MTTTTTPALDPASLRGLFDLRGRRALVAGATGGIGEAIAWALALAGAEVVIGARDAAKVGALREALHASGHAAMACVLDANSVASIRDGVAAAGPLDILVNCIGIQREEPLLDVTEEAYDEVLRLNLKAAMFLAQAAAKSQIAGGRGGAQLHLLSVRARLGLRGRGYSAYCSSKGGLQMLVRQHAAELAPHGIRVNGLAPTVVRTEMARHWLDDPTTRDQITGRIPLGRIAEPADVAGAAVFLCSPGASFVTGQVLYLDGGISATQ
jgi:NAD(P)-dependent dehydrogenase (short-subunit alcohol dehydrogenase family)